MNTLTETVACRGNLILTLSFIGEGFDGDYNANDPLDKPLLRFDISIRSGNGVLDEISDASFCTNLSNDRSVEDVNYAANLLLDIVADEINSNGRAKRTCENLSWADWEWIDFCRTNGSVMLPMEFLQFLKS